MKKLALLLAIVMLSGCGNKSTGTQFVGQVKKVAHITPLLCPDYDLVDVSLGVVRNGVGSMSTEDMHIQVLNAKDLELLLASQEKGLLVKGSYVMRRTAFCVPQRKLTKVEVTK